MKLPAIIKRIDFSNMNLRVKMTTLFIASIIFIILSVWAAAAPTNAQPDPGPDAAAEETVTTTAQAGSTIETLTVEYEEAFAADASSVTDETPAEPETAATTVTAVTTTKKHVATTRATTKKPAPEVTTAPYVSPAAPSTDEAQRIIDCAKQYLGVPYKAGGASPSGFDCSGYTSYVFKQCGYTISRSSAAQANDGVYVKRGDLRPGDIVLFSSPKSGGKVGHSAIYLGDNKIINAQSGKTRKVCISSMASGYFSDRFIMGRRIIKN